MVRFLRRRFENILSNPQPLKILLDSDFVNVLVPIHDLAGADSLSKVGTKSKACKEGLKHFALLSGFGRQPLTDEMINNAERFLLKCVTKHDVKSFDELRYVVFHKKYLEFSIERFPPTSDSIRQHIMRAYLQSYKRLLSPFLENITLKPVDLGYRVDEDKLVPVISTKPSIPSNFPHPCSCIKCSKANVCKCRLLGIACCQSCKCKACPHCKNPVK